VSADAGSLAIGDAAGRVMVFPGDGGVPRTIKAVAETQVQALAWSPDGQQVAVGTDDGTIRLADHNGNDICTFNLLSSRIDHIVFSPDGRWLIAGQRSGPTRVWDTISREQVLDGPLVPWTFARDSTKDSWRFAGTHVGRVAFGKIERRVGAYYLHGHQVPIFQVVWSRDGRHLASLDTRRDSRLGFSP
jgi:WD40 repeat protein